MSRKKILILGAAGMAGHMVYKHLNMDNEFEIAHTVRSRKINSESIQLDVYNRKELRRLVEVFNPDFIINCIGVLISGATKNSENAIFVNSYFPHLLKGIADSKESKLIHISTDCVFSGKKGSYRENDFKDADDVYGRSKALGEINDKKHLTIRTSIIGPELKEDGEGLFHWFMNQNEQVTGFSNVFWGGVTTLELARFIKSIIKEPKISGLIHLTNNEKISKKKLLELINEKFSCNIKILDLPEKKSDKSLISSQASIYKFVKTYEEMIVDMRDYMFKSNDYKYLL